LISESGGLGDLSSLAAKFEISSPTFLTNKKFITNKNLASCVEEADGARTGSSIDKLLDSFFTETMTSKMEVKINTNEDDNQDLSNLIYNRTKSISIDLKITAQSTTAAFSLSDLASQFLSTSATTGNSDNHTAAFSSSTSNLIVDLIDHEFSKQMTLNDNGETEDVDHQMVDLGGKNIIMINNRSGKDKQKLSASYELSNSISSSLGLSSSLTNAMASRTAVELIAPPPVEDIASELRVENDKSLFILDETSILGRLFFCRQSLSRSQVTATRSLEFADRFDYVTQVKLMLKRRKLVSKSRKRLRIEKNEPFKIPTNSVAMQASMLVDGVKKTAVAAGVGKRKSGASSSSSSKNQKSLKKRAAEAEDVSVKVFDFSLPSPDDLILAKQKLAFKNLRFK
jgi:hypothetical protein